MRGQAAIEIAVALFFLIVAFIFLQLRVSGEATAIYDSKAAVRAEQLASIVSGALDAASTSNGFTQTFDLPKSLGQGEAYVLTITNTTVYVTWFEGTPFQMQVYSPHAARRVFNSTGSSVIRVTPYPITITGSNSTVLVT